ncbi:Rgg family transcriptional regulator [Leuconostoc inhae]
MTDKRKYKMTIEETFHHLRTSKKLTLTALADQNASASFIGKFEKHETNMSVSRFFKLLEKMHVSQAEFEFLLQENQDTYLTRRIHLINDQPLTLQSLAHFHDTVEKDRNNDLDNQASQFLMILADGLALLLTHDVKQWPDSQLSAQAKPIQNYLLSVDIWGIYELQLFTLFSFMLPVDVLYLLTKVAIKRVRSYENSLLNIQAHLMNVIWTSFSTLVYEDLSAAHQLLDMADTYLIDHIDVTEKITLMFNKGWYAIEAGHIEKGKQRARTAINIYHSLGYNKKASDLEQQLAHHIKRQEEKKHGYKPDGSRVISLYI